MARKSETVTIDGETYEVTQLGAIEGSSLYHELVKALGPMLREELPKQLDQEASGALAGIIIRAIEVLPGDLVARMRTAFMRNCKLHTGGIAVEMTESIFDQHFAGRYGLMTKWMVHCLKLNFAGFLGDSAPAASPQPAEKA